MKRFKPSLALLVLLFVFQIPDACPPIYVNLAAYVQYEGENVTKSELLKLNLNDVKDTSGKPIIDKNINRFSIHTKEVGSLKFENYYSEYSEEMTIHETYRKMMDTILPKLNLLDTVKVNFNLLNTKKSSDNVEEEFFYHGFRYYLIKQQFIISSQAVVDLKRSGPESGMVAYPSPATDNVSVRFDVKEPIAGHISVINSLGQVVAELDQPNLMNVSHFDLKDQKSGSYYVRARIDGEYFTKKIIKE